MAYRIVTHSNCTDGFSSAFVVKKYFNILLEKNLSQKEIDLIRIVGAMPPDIQTGSFKVAMDDIIVDLPNPKTEVSFWCDHHDTSKPRTVLPNHYYWKKYRFPLKNRRKYSKLTSPHNILSNN